MKIEEFIDHVTITFSTVRVIDSDGLILIESRINNSSGDIDFILN
jgi:hypothetical protein